MSREEILERVMIKLKENYPELDLDQLIALEKKKRRFCPQAECPCYNEETAFKDLCEQIEQIKDILQKPPKKPTSAVLERVGETPLPDNRPLVVSNKVTIEEVDEFFTYVSSEFTNAWNDPLNIFPGHKLYPPARRCDCVRWLIQTFDQLRFTAVRRIYYNFRKHNTVCNAIFCLAIESKIIEREEMRTVRNSVYPYTDWWWRHVNVLIGRRYVRARKKTKIIFQSQRFVDCQMSKVRFEAFMRKLHVKFPKFFINDTDKIDPTTFDNPDPGSVFTCRLCEKKYPERYGIGCLKQIEGQVPNAEEEATKFEHFTCRPCTRKSLTESINVGSCNKLIGLRCFTPECKQIIDPGDVRPYVDEEIRLRINGRLLEMCMNMGSDLAHEEYATN